MPDEQQKEEEKKEAKKEIEVDLSELVSRMRMEHLLVFCGAVLIFISVFLPWGGAAVSALSWSGISTGQGVATLIFSLLIIASVGARVMGILGKQLYSISLIVFGGICALCALSGMTYGGPGTSIGFGAVLSLLFALGVTAMGVLPLANIKVDFFDRSLESVFRQRPEEEPKTGDDTNVEEKEDEN